MKKTVTLMELIIAIALMGVVIVGVTVFDFSSRQFLQSAERKTKVLNEAALIIDRIVKDALSAVGTRDNPAIAVAANGINMYPDTNGDGIHDTNDDTRWIRYRYINTATHPHTIERLRRPTVGADEIEYISTRAINLATSPVTGATPADTNTVQLILILRFDPTSAVNAINNPQVRIQTSVEVPGWSLN